MLILATLRPFGSLRRALLLTLGLLATLAAPAPSLAQVQVPLAPQEWKPVRIGTGGLVTGMVIHPADATLRYARTDVGNAYRWDEPTQLWVPLLVYNPGSPGGVPAEWGQFFAETGVESIQIDPSDPDIVFVAAQIKRTDDLDPFYPARPVGILLKSTDCGLSFTATGATFPLTPNANAKNFGERIAVDPANSSVVYFGTPLDGLRLSLDAGQTWSLVGGLPPSANVINITYAPTGGTTTVSGQLRTAVLYATAFDSAVYRSADGGQTWADITTGVTVSGHSIAGRTRMTEIDSLGRLYVTRSGSNQYWRYADSAWTIVTAPNTAKSLAIDPANPLRLFALSDGSAFSRSLDGGATWTQLRSPAGWLKFAPGTSPISWLPQPYDTFRSNGGIRLDRHGRLWIPQGNEGILTCLPSDTHTAATFPGWTLQGRGIEELVAHEVVIPPGSGDKPILTVHDAAAFIIDDPDQFTARQIPGQRAIISNGLGIAYAPDDPTFIAFSAGDVNFVNTGPERGANYSAFSDDGGINWTPFPGTQYTPALAATETIVAGQIAVGRRTHLTPGQERLVVLPSNDRPPAYSHDRGATWHASSGVPVTEFGTVVGGSMSSFSHRARLLIADPFINDRFYYITRLESAYRSDDGGQTWIDQNTTGLPIYRFHSQLEANRTLPGDFWFVAGYDGTTPAPAKGAPQPFGLFRSTDHIATFTRNPTVEFASCIALGKGRGQPGDEPFTVYILGKLVGVADWGVFYSADAGLTWSRFAYNPAGLFDRPSMMAASWDTFGLLYLGFAGNTYVYGRALPATPPTLTTSPASQALAFGQSATLSAAATGSPAPLYQWQRQPAGTTTWADIPGAISATFTPTFTPADVGALYRVRAFNSAGSVASAPVTLTPPLAVTVNAPAGTAPHTVTFTATTTGALLAPVGDTAVGGTATAQGFTSSFTAANAFDGAPATRWFHFNQINGSATSSWLQYTYAPGIRHTVREYSLTMPGDLPNRNPATWALLGSNDATNWTTLDTRTGQSLAINQTATYAVSSPAPYAHYRLRIDSVALPSGAGGPQIAELRLLDNITLRSPAYLWDFGNGQTSTAASPSFTFQNPGTYPVTLTYADSYRSVQVNFTVQALSPIPTQLTFLAGPTVSTTGLTHINNPIDLDLAAFPITTTPLTPYTQTLNNNPISGTLTRQAPATGTLLTATDFNTLLAAAQTAAVTSGVIPFHLGAANGTTGTNNGTSFAGTNATGSLTITANTSLATAFQQREFTTTGDVVGTGATNSIGISGFDVQLTAPPSATFSSRTGYLNLNQTTLTFGTPLSAVGFTQLHRDGTRTYTWTVNLIDLAAPSAPPVAITLGTLAFTGLSVGASTGGPAAPNYRYDTFVGYLAPAGHAIASLRWSGGSFGNIDGLAYIAQTPAPLALTFASWRTAQNLTTASTFSTDTDADGLPDGLEFLLGTDPQAASQSHSALTATADGLTFTHPVNETATLGTTLQYEWSTDLSTWHRSGQTSPSGTTATLAASAPADGQVTVTLTVTSGPRDRLFTRLVATPAP